MTQTDKDFDRQMAIAREQMERRKVALSVLGKGDSSPHMSDDFRMQIMEADKRLEKYKKAKRL
ncbi:hypothetical protein [Mesorhizobium australicum]|uniref:Uncharacterized protein n=1 Tax=Mesorhizobium australicum TaxID=536018 RepID=A0A1X7NUV1_9HYPH|nr:hypothetical protein [Mesorhizobium australicum]SMH42005.1 hypothetical protein SAMN02982922_2672 [Mesorhizobium australicum]